MHAGSSARVWGHLAAIPPVGVRWPVPFPEYLPESGTQANWKFQLLRKWPSQGQAAWCRKRQRKHCLRGSSSDQRVSGATHISSRQGLVSLAYWKVPSFGWLQLVSSREWWVSGQDCAIQWQVPRSGSTHHQMPLTVVACPLTMTWWTHKVSREWHSWQLKGFPKTCESHGHQISEIDMSPS